MNLFNLHTHYPSVSPNEIVIQDFSAEQILSSPYYSISLHPWTLDSNKPSQTTEAIKLKEKDHNFVALGECGLDKLCPTPFEFQFSAFRLMIELSEKYNKPLIIHCVKAFDEIIALKKEFQSKQTWIIHGFRGNPMQALQLIKQGFYLSFGPKHNSETIKLIPLGAIFAETDDSGDSIDSVYRLIASELNISVDDLARIILDNAIKYLNITI